MKTKNTFWLFVSAILPLSLIVEFNSDTMPTLRSYQVPTTPNYKEYKKMKPSLGFKQLYSDPDFEDLTMIGTPGKFGVENDQGKILRALRFKNITDAVEDRYNLPRYLLLAMVTKESNGIDLLPNGLGDGGYGLCHMQPLIAQEFGLKTYRNCNAMVCNGEDSRSCRSKNGQRQNHALGLKKLIEAKDFDRKLLISYDDRLHPIINIDAVGRMMASYMDGPRISGCGPLRTAVCRYAGRYNYRQYWQSVRYYMNLFEDEKFIANLEKAFNAINSEFKVNGYPGNFDEYIRVSQLQNFNYGLTEYKNLPKFIPKNSAIVKRTYRNF